MASLLTSQAQTVDAPKKLAATVKPPYTARQVGMRPRCTCFPGEPRPPDQARRGHTDANHGRGRALDPHAELPAFQHLGQHRPGFRTDVRLALPQVRKNVAAAGKESREPVPTGGPSSERGHRPAPLDGSKEDENYTPFAENRKI